MLDGLVHRSHITTSIANAELMHLGLPAEVEKADPLKGSEPAKVGVFCLCQWHVGLMPPRGPGRTHPIE
jgi:hypothetical protein